MEVPDAGKADGLDTIKRLFMEKHVIIGTAGHVDHGKTTLVRALTGTDPDRLPEEKARQMTVDLGFAFLRLPGEPPICAGIVDVPGHERLVKNMLAGAGGFDVALLVVAADDGVMPQTREHLDILWALGIERGVVALTRWDLASEAQKADVQNAVRALLAPTPLRDAPLVPVSAPSGFGLDALKTAVARECALAPPRDLSAPFRLPVDRSFSVPGTGCVVTGTLTQGTLRTGDGIAILPGGIKTRARRLQSHNEIVEEAVAGMRVAVNVPGMELHQAERGVVLCSPGAFDTSQTLDARLAVLPNAPRAVKNRERVRLSLGTHETLARLVLPKGTRELLPGAINVPVRFLCETAAVVPPLDEAFVVRTYSPAFVIGGGHRGEADTASFAASPHVAALLVLIEASYEERTAAALASAANAPLADVEAALEELTTSGRIVCVSPVDEGDVSGYLSLGAWERVAQTARRTLAAFHKKNPYKKAMPLGDLRAPLQKAATLWGHDVRRVARRLEADGVLVWEPGKGVRLPDHDVILPPGWQKAAGEILAVYQSAGLNPPPPHVFEPHYPRDVNTGAIIRILTENGDLVSIGDGLLLASPVVDKAKDAARKLAQSPEGLTVGTLRDATGSSRKVILPLLEWMDAQNFTMRRGDGRVLRPPS